MARWYISKRKQVKPSQKICERLTLVQLGKLTLPVLGRKTTPLRLHAVLTVPVGTD